MLGAHFTNITSHRLPQVLLQNVAFGSVTAPEAWISLAWGKAICHVITGPPKGNDTSRPPGYFVPTPLFLWCRVTKQYYRCCNLFFFLFHSMLKSSVPHFQVSINMLKRDFHHLKKHLLRLKYIQIWLIVTHLINLS